MSSRLRAIARDTVAICDRGSYETPGALLESPYQVAFLTAAAPNLTAV